MTVVPFPKPVPIVAVASPAATAAVIDVLRERHRMLTTPGHTLADEDLFTDNEILISALQLIDASLVAASPIDRRELLVTAVALQISELERIDRALENDVAASTNPGA